MVAVFYFPSGDISDCFRFLLLRFPESGTGVAVLLLGVLDLGVLVLLLAGVPAPSVDFRLDLALGVEVVSSSWSMANESYSCLVFFLVLLSLFSSSFSAFLLDFLAGVADPFFFEDAPLAGVSAVNLPISTMSVVA